MPWKKSDSEKERTRFAVQAEEGLYSVTELCARYGVSRQTGHTTLRRFRELGPDGLKERSHAPLHCPHRIGEEMRERLLAAKKTHPHWGPRKILAWLQPRNPELVLPAASTVGDLYLREHLVERRRRQRKWSQPGRTQVGVHAPNDVWKIDYKGEFRLGDGSCASRSRSRTPTLGSSWRWTRYPRRRTPEPGSWSSASSGSTVCRR